MMNAQAVQTDALQNGLGPSAASPHAQQVRSAPSPMPSPAPAPMPAPPPPSMPHTHQAAPQLRPAPPMPSQTIPAPAMPSAPVPTHAMPHHTMPPAGMPRPAYGAPLAAHPAPQGYSAAPASAVMPQMPPLDETRSDGGEKALPSLSIHSFCDRNETAAMINEASRDWRMKRTNVKIYMGGLPAAVEFYHQENTPNLILIESGMRGPELFAQLEQLASVCDANTKVVVIGATNDIKLYRQLIDKGVSDYLVPPFHPLNLIRSLSEIYVDPDKPFVGRVTAFFGAKGGTGSSTLAHNVAWCLAENLGQETSLVDLDASWGTTGLDFAYDASQGLEEALEQPDRLDETLLDRIMLRHSPKLSILPTSGVLTRNPIDNTEAFEAVVDGVRGISPMTILDMPHVWSDWTMSVMTSADDIVITATPDLANLRNTKSLIDFLKTQRPNDSKPILILNKIGLTKANEISVKDFAAAVGMDPAVTIGFDPDTFTEAANDGKMLTELKAASGTVAGLEYIASRLKTGEFEPMSRKSKGRKSAKGLRGTSDSQKSKSFLSRFKKES